MALLFSVQQGEGDGGEDGGKNHGGDGPLGMTVGVEMVFVLGVNSSLHPDDNQADDQKQKETHHERMKKKISLQTMPAVCFLVKNGENDACEGRGNDCSGA